jgi:AmpE protein
MHIPYYVMSYLEFRKGCHMKLLVLLTCLLFQTFFNLTRSPKDRYRLLDHYYANMKPFLIRLEDNTGWVTLIGLLLPLLVLIVLLGMLFSYVAIFYFIYAVIVLSLCLHLRNMKRQLKDYFTTAASEDFAKTQAKAEQFIASKERQDAREISRAVTEVIFVRSLTDIFSVVFWFLVAGPFGAVLYYMTTAITYKSLEPEFSFPNTHPTANCLKDILDWLPIRIVSLTFAIIGHFTPVFNLWLERLGSNLSENRPFIIDSGLIALNANPDPLNANLTENRQAFNLVTRALSAWIIILVLAKIIAWL